MKLLSPEACRQFMFQPVWLRITPTKYIGMTNLSDW